MRPYAEVLAELYQKYGGNKSQIARKLGNGISSQRLGQYEAGKMEPKQDFIEIWKKTFGDDLTAIRRGVETNVSHGTLPAQKIIDLDVWQELKINNEEIRKNNATFKQEIEKLWAERDKFWSLIDRLTPVVEGGKSHKR